MRAGAAGSAWAEVRAAGVGPLAVDVATAEGMAGSWSAGGLRLPRQGRVTLDLPMHARAALLLRRHETPTGEGVGVGWLVVGGFVALPSSYSTPIGPRCRFRLLSFSMHTPHADTPACSDTETATLRCPLALRMGGGPWGGAQGWIGVSASRATRSGLGVPVVAGLHSGASRCGSYLRAAGRARALTDATRRGADDRSCDRSRCVQRRWHSRARRRRTRPAAGGVGPTGVV